MNEGSLWRFCMYSYKMIYDQKILEMIEVYPPLSVLSISHVFDFLLPILRLSLHRFFLGAGGKEAASWNPRLHCDNDISQCSGCSYGGHLLCPFWELFHGISSSECCMGMGINASTYAYAYAKSTTTTSTTTSTFTTTSSVWNLGYGPQLKELECLRSGTCWYLLNENEQNKNQTKYDRVM